MTRSVQLPRAQKVLRLAALFGLGITLGVGLPHAAFAGDGTAAPSVRALSVPSDGRRPEAPGAEVRPLGFGTEPFGEGLNGETFPEASSPVSNVAKTFAAVQREPVLRLFHLGTMGLPKASLERIARDLAKLGLPYTVRGLPWKTVAPDADRKDVLRSETTLERLTEPFNREKTPIHVDPRPFHALEAAWQKSGRAGALPLPLWFVTLEGRPGEPAVTEVLPGDLSPLCALGILLARTESPALRERLRADLRARIEASTDETEKADATWDEILACADLSSDVRPEGRREGRPEAQSETRSDDPSGKASALR